VRNFNWLPFTPPLVASSVLQTLWRERNSRIFEGLEKQTPRLVSKIKDEAKLWIQAGVKKLSGLVRWVVHISE
jgi:hypothetical protein